MLLSLHLREEPEDSKSMEGRGSPESVSTETVSIREASGDFAKPELTTMGFKPLLFCSSVLQEKKYDFLVVLWLPVLPSTAPSLSLWKHT